jgi:IS30 family transposase
MHKSPPRSYQQLQPEDRQTLASLIHQGYGVRHIACVLVRSPTNVSRELRRNAHALGYAGVSAHTACLHRRRLATPPKKLHADGLLFGVVRHFLGLRCSPEQIALTLARIHPKGDEHRVSHESIYNCI